MSVIHATAHAHASFAGTGAVPARRATPLRAALALSFALSFALLSACTDAQSTAPVPSPAPRPVVARVLLSATLGAVRAGNALQLHAFAVSAAGDTLRDRPITWRTDDTSIATVSASGQVLGVGPGVVTIRASAGDIVAAATVTVSGSDVSSIELDIAQLELEEGTARQLVAGVYDQDGTTLSGQVITWSTSDANVATVSANGVVTALRWGATEVRASVSGKVARATVHVTTRSQYDLLFDSRTGYANEPEMYALDIRSPLAAPARIGVASPGTWDVTPSPDGTRIAFVAREPFGPQLFIARRDGTGARMITSETGGADQPSWSPDGTRIAFRAWNAGGPPGPFNAADIKVVTVNAAGSVLHTASLTANSGTGISAEWPTWSPSHADGHHRVAYSSQRLAGYLLGRIMSVRDDGAEPRALTEAGEYLESQPAWSPDGRSILFVRTGGTASGDILTLDVAAGTTRQLMASDPAHEQHAPAWSPDGALIAFSSKHEPGADGNYFFQLYTVAPDGTGLTRRTPSGGDKSNPAWILRR